MRILLVEDDPMIGESVSEWLQGDGYAVDWLQDGDSALLALHTTPFALVILDLGLPGRDGLEVLKEIRSKESHIPVLITTARDTVDDRIAGLDSGADDYLIKPFDYNRFQTALQKFVSRREAFAGDKAFNQEELDKVISPEGQRGGQFVDKGIHPVTLEIICSFLREHKSEKLSIEDIAKNVSLSRVTLRRYMNYLIDKNSVIGGVDYSTGGRPSAVYTYIGK